MKGLQALLPLILIDATYGGLRTWNRKREEKLVHSKDTDLVKDPLYLNKYRLDSKQQRPLQYLSQHTLDSNNSDHVYPLNDLKPDTIDSKNMHSKVLSLKRQKDEQNISKRIGSTIISKSEFGSQTFSYKWKDEYREDTGHIEFLDKTEVEQIQKLVHDKKVVQVKSDLELMLKIYDCGRYTDKIEYLDLSENEVKTWNEERGGEERGMSILLGSSSKGQDPINLVCNDALGHCIPFIKARTFPSPNRIVLIAVHFLPPDDIYCLNWKSPYTLKGTYYKVNFLTTYFTVCGFGDTKNYLPEVRGADGLFNPIHGNKGFKIEGDTKVTYTIDPPIVPDAQGWFLSVSSNILDDLANASLKICLELDEGNSCETYDGVNTKKTFLFKFTKPLNKIEITQAQASQRSSNVQAIFENFEIYSADIINKVEIKLPSTYTTPVSHFKVRDGKAQKSSNYEADFAKSLVIPIKTKGSDKYITMNDLEPGKLYKSLSIIPVDADGTDRSSSFPTDILEGLANIVPCSCVVSMIAYITIHLFYLNFSLLDIQYRRQDRSTN